MAIEVRRLGVGDEELVRRLSIENARFEEVRAPGRARSPHTLESAREFLAAETNFQLAALVDGEPVGLLLAYELIRRHGDGKMMFVYELGVRADHRRTGVGRALVEALRDLCRERGVARAFVFTNEGNEAAMAFYSSLGAAREAADDVLFDFDWSGDASDGL